MKMTQQRNTLRIVLWMKMSIKRMMMKRMKRRKMPKKMNITANNKWKKKSI